MHESFRKIVLTNTSSSHLSDFNSTKRYPALTRADTVRRNLKGLAFTEDRQVNFTITYCLCI